MKDIVINPSLVSNCGLYCGSCKRYIKGKCQGCSKNIKATWCKTRKCNIEMDYKSCADCSIINLKDCKINNNFVSKAFGFVFNTDRISGLELIREKGYEEFSKQMAQSKQMSIKRNK